MFSSMESSGDDRQTPGEAAAALADAEAGLTTLANRVEMPRFFFSILGIAVAVQLGGSAVGLAGGGGHPVLIVIVVNLLFLAVCGLELMRFRKLNGVWLGGLASRVVGGTATAASVSYGIAFGAALWAAFAEVWWLVPVCAAAGGVGYALSGSAWLRRYYNEPAANGRGESAVWLTVAVVLSLAGLVLLVALR